MIFKVCTMILRLGFAIALSMLVASTQAYAFQESDLTTKVPPCKEKVSGPIKDKRGFLIPNPRLIDLMALGNVRLLLAQKGNILMRIFLMTLVPFTSIVDLDMKRFTCRALTMGFRPFIT